ncbi:MAG: hypothetical protein GYA60_02745, partial [Candidatus Methanofastidiosa archaeon]|nr:hypothetical protein [Candidatus Methanofastidiosa archaeon]
MRYTKIIVIAILLGIITYFLFDIQLNNYNQNLEKDLIIINCFYSINNDSYLEDLSFYHDYYQEEDSFNRNIFNSSAIIYKSFSVNLGKTETSFVIKFHTWKKVKDKWLYLYMINTHSYYMYNIDKIKSIKINDDIDGQKQTYTKDDLSTDKYNYYGNFRLEHEMFNKENGIYTIEILMEPIPIETNE